MVFTSAVALLAATLFSSSVVASDWNCQSNPFKYVVQISVDGLHSSDVEKYLSARSNSNISQLLQHGYEYTNAYTTAPSDSFPGSMAQFTGATPKTTGVWYDDVWRRNYYEPGSNCTGPAGAEGKSSRPVSQCRQGWHSFSMP